MQYRQFTVLVLLLLAAMGCGGDPTEPVSGEVAGEGEFSSLLESGYTVEKFVGDLGDARLQVTGALRKRLEAAIAGSREQVGKLQLEVQRFSADALLSSEARATRDALESGKGELALLESKLAAVLKHIGLQQTPGK